MDIQALLDQIFAFIMQLMELILGFMGFRGGRDDE